jgi:hypothetical protein
VLSTTRRAISLRQILANDYTVMYNFYMPNIPEVYTHPSITDMPEYMLGEFANRNLISGREYEQPESRGSNQRHITRSSQEILAAASLGRALALPDSDRNAIILGAGNCIDIPLTELALPFDSTTLVDAHAGAMQQAVSALPLTDMQHVRLVRADATGSLAKFADRVQNVAADKPTYESFASAAATAITDIDPKDTLPDLGSNYTFVCSQLVLSQLGGIPLSFLEHVTRRTYNSEPSDPARPSSQILLEAMHIFITSLHRAHIDLLAGLVAPTGSVYFADTYSQLTMSQPKPMFDHRAVNTKLQKHFEAAQQGNVSKHWMWKPAPDRLFWVQAHLLRPKTV